MSKSQALLACAAIGAVAVVGTLAAGVSRQNSVAVYFDNGLETHVKVQVGDESFNLSYGAPMKRQMKPGSYEVVILDGDREVERTRIEIVKKDLMSALLDPEFYVYNIGEIHIYRRATLGYAVAESDQTYSEQLFPFQHFFSQPDADYVFEDAPQEIKTQSSQETRDEFTIARDHDYNTIATMKYNEGNLVEARRAVEKALAMEPCHVNAFRNRIALLSLEGPSPEAQEVALGFRDACDDAGVEAHRAYQDTMMELGGRETLLSDYRSRQRRQSSAENDYLLARLLPDAESLPLYRSALAKDPAFARARLALAYDLMGLERYGEALSEIETTLDASMLIQDAASLYAYAAVGAGATEAADGRLRALGNQHPADLAIWQARWTTTLARGDWNEAERLLIEYRRNAGEEGWSQKMQLLGLKGEHDEATRRLQVDLQRQELAPLAQPLHFQALFSQGEYGEAAACLESYPLAANDLHQLYAAVGLALAGRREDSRLRLAQQAEALRSRGGTVEEDFYRSAVAFLSGRASEQEALAAAREAGFYMVPHAYFLVGAQKRAGGDDRAATAYFQKSASTAVTLTFPYLAASAFLEP